MSIFQHLHCKEQLCMCLLIYQFFFPFDLSLFTGVFPKSCRWHWYYVFMTFMNNVITFYLFLWNMYCRWADLRLFCYIVIRILFTSGGHFDFYQHFWRMTVCYFKNWTWPIEKRTSHVTSIYDIKSNFYTIFDNRDWYFQQSLFELYSLI